MRRKKSSLTKIFWRIIIVLLVVINAIYFIASYFNKPPRIKYPAFGINIPPGYLIHGIDISRYQRTINWEDVKEMEVKNIKIGFVFIKATEGIGKVDEQFRKNWLGAEQAEIPKGAYHFFIAGKSGAAQAKNFLEIVQLKKGDLPPVLDVEETYNTKPEEMIREIKVWLQKVEEACFVKPILYSNISFYSRYLKGHFKDYPVWIAHYLQPAKPRLNNEWIFWQHSEKGRVNGIKTPVDFNVYQGDSTTFAKLLIK